MAGGTSSAHIALQARPTRSRRRARRSPQSLSSSATPSSGLLALIATVAGSSSSVDARPLQAAPLTFLYPFIDNQSLQTPSRTVSAPDAPFPTPTKHQASRRGASLADKYESGTDGRWRKMSEYTLYGSTITRSIPTSMPVDDAAGSTSSPSSSGSTEATSTSISYDDLYDSLPYGWKPSDDSPRPTTIIAVLSVLLAILIIVVIGVSAYWRRRRKIARTKDPEKKLRRRGDGEDEPIEDEDPSDAQLIRSQKRMWVRATARWKANARQSFRRRRGRRVAQKHADSLRSTSRGDLRDNRSDRSSSRPRSRSPSMTSSSNLAASLHANTRPQSMRSVSRSSLHEHLPEPPVRSTTPPSSPPFPPAYYRTPYRSLGRDDSLHLHIPNSPFMDPDSESLPPFSGNDDEEMSLPPANTVAHVATDDKAVLARMAAMSSAPPQVDDHNGMSSDPRPRVPSWYDEDLDYSQSSHDSSFGQEPRVYTTGSCVASSSQLPPPPTKAQLAAPLFYDYPSSFEEDLVDSEPSAPPFEECVGMPSAPPLVPEDNFPSAPPSDDMDEVSHLPALAGDEFSASAPPLEEFGGEQSVDDEEPRPSSRAGIGVHADALPSSPES
ncbi:hypothetical protein OE88DRAFT_56668 [Heliocybe sulcata]|uniref:Uncharacterized protein n=1 Tax=Heliocybe sulcata TaxID=5364 RepID=A0A5C3NJY0_9AGAM|nr:hypothetical protein OE88DRAFT_56668 [Heliocybe sulcata]